MNDFAANKEDFGNYFNKTIGWFIVFCILSGFGLVIFVTSTLCVSCPKCCTPCKKDLKRSDY